jgi:hypothetical protein
MKLPREKSGCEIADDRRLNLTRFDAGIFDCRPSRLDNHVAEGFALLAEIPPEVGAPGADDVNALGHDAL